MSPTLFSLIGLTTVVLTKELLGYSDLVINRGLGANAVLQIAFFQVVPLMTLVFPLAVLMGVLVALGRLGADLEILVLETLGVRATRLAGPIGVFAIVMALVCMGLSLVAAPWASRSLDQALLDLSRENPAAQMRAGKINRFGDWRLEAREVSARGDTMKNVLLWMPDLGDTVFAASGTLTANEAGGIDMTLRNGRVILEPKAGPRHVEFATLEATLPNSDKPIERDDKETLTGFSLDELRAQADRELSTGKRYPDALVEWHRRFSTPATTLIFGLIAIPLFLTRKEYSRSAGGIWGLGTIIAYFGLVQLGDGLIQDQTLSAAMGVWLPNVIVGGVGIWLFSTIASKGVFGREVDRQRGRQSRRRERNFRGARQWALPRYVAGRFFQFALLAFGVLLSAYLLIDILERLGWFAKYEATGLEVARFYGARIPLLASRVIPMSLLVATALTSSHLAVQGELMGMRACGIPASRALFPVLVICVGVIPLFFLLNNEVIPRAAARQDEIKLNEIKSRSESRKARSERSARKSDRPPVWYRVSGQLYQVGLLDAKRGVAEQIAIYDLEKNGLPTRRTFADSARHIGKGNWRLANARNFELRDDRFYETEAVEFAKLGQELPASVDTMHFSIAQLRREIDEVEANDLDATALSVDYYGKLASPLACIVLPAIVLFFAVMGPPFPSSSTTLFVSGVLGIGSVLLNGTGASLGYGGALSPLVAGWGPTALLAVIALALAARVGGQGMGK